MSKHNDSSLEKHFDSIDSKIAQTAIFLGCIYVASLLFDDFSDDDFSEILSNIDDIS